MYGVFYATSFLDLYRSPRQVRTSSLSLMVTVDSDEQYLFLVSLLDITPTSSEVFTNCFILLKQLMPSSVEILCSTSLFALANTATVLLCQTKVLTAVQ